MSCNVGKSRTLGDILGRRGMRVFRKPHEFVNLVLHSAFQCFGFFKNRACFHGIVNHIPGIDATRLSIDGREGLGWGCALKQCMPQKAMARH
jgi:hypothetical protein